MKNWPSDEERNQLRATIRELLSQGIEPCIVLVRLQEIYIDGEDDTKALHKNTWLFEVELLAMIKNLLQGGEKNENKI